MSSFLRSILAATDLGEGSDSIVRSAGLLAARTGADLHLLHSLELPWVPADDVLRRSGFFGQIQTAEERLQAQADRTLPASVAPASQKVIIYIAHKAIQDRAKEASADLIVMGPHRGGEASARFLGTTADRVIRTAEVPCLLVEQTLAERVDRIGVPFDFSDPSQAALETALAWGVQIGQQAGESAGTPTIRVMHVAWAVEHRDLPETERRVVRPALEGQVERAIARVPGAESLDVAFDVLWADEPTEAAVQWAESAGIDLVVMGTHGRGGLKRVLLGSVAHGVARRTSRPVLLVPPRARGASSTSGTSAE